MKKRFYLFLSVLAALGALAVMVSAFEGQKEKAQEKGQKESPAKAETAAQVFTWSGTGSYLGVYLEEVTSDRVKELNLNEERGALITKVVSGSPAEKAGLKENDVVVSFNSKRIDSVREFQRILGETPADRTVQVEVIRGGGHQTVAATLSRRQPGFGYAVGAPEWNTQEWPQSEEAQKKLEEANKRLGELMRRQEQGLSKIPDLGDYNFVNPGGFNFFKGTRLGISAESLTTQLAEFFGVKDGHGVLVASIDDNSAAARAGLKAGDVIIAVDDQKIENINSLINALAKKEGSTKLRIVRNRAEQTLTVTLEKRAEIPGFRRRAAIARSAATI